MTFLFKEKHFIHHRPCIHRVAGKSDIWGAMRKQMREFTLNTQQQLEQERARLLSENHVLKEQLRESQQYIDSHLVRWVYVLLGGVGERAQLLSENHVVKE